MFALGGIGLGPGAHRFFSHKSYKATRPLKIFLIICQSIAGQYSLIDWCMFHRTHHKFTDTDKDPTNINRGFWFSHLLWIFHYTPEVRKGFQSIDLSDLKADKDVMCQHKYYPSFYILFCVFLPTIIPCILWNENIWVSFFVNFWRWILNYNQMSFANSLLHMVGKKPYDKNMSATEHVFCILYTYGEGYHNYHHVFPWDYKSAEFGDFLHFNVQTLIIDYWAEKGWVWDRKFVTQSMIDRRKARTGDGTHWLTSEGVLKNPLWGYGDPLMDEDDQKDLKNLDYNSNNISANKLII